MVASDQTRLRSVIIVEDDEDIADSIRYNLEREGFRVRLATTGEDALNLILDRPPNLILLDLNLPHMNGFELCRRLRAESTTARVPILMLTARAEEADKVLGLNMGADDYITKPFSMRELVARVKAILRRVDSLGQAAGAARSKAIACGALSLDAERREVRLGERQIDLTAKEFDLLLHFARNPGRVFTRAQLLDQVWGYSHSGYDHTVNSHINRLRAKIEGDPNHPDFIQTVWGVGYKFRDPS
jgi:DNA-binding response OmpR family regulator